MTVPFCYTCGQYHHYGTCPTYEDPDRDSYPCEIFDGPLDGGCCKCGWPEEDHPYSYSPED